MTGGPGVKGWRWAISGEGVAGSGPSGCAAVPGAATRTAMRTMTAGRMGRETISPVAAVHCDESALSRARR